MRLTAKERDQLTRAMDPLMWELRGQVSFAKKLHQALREGPLNIFLKGMLKSIGTDSDMSFALDEGQLDIYLNVTMQSRVELFKYLAGNGYTNPILYQRTQFILMFPPDYWSDMGIPLSAIRIHIHSYNARAYGR